MLSVKINEESVELTEREFQMWEILYQNLSHLVTQEELQEKLGLGHPQVWSLLGRLRRKIQGKAVVDCVHSKGLILFLEGREYETRSGNDISIKGENLNLSDRELKLWNTLNLNQSEVVSPKELMGILNISYPYLLQILASLRRKLPKGAEIVNVRTKGYKIENELYC